MKRVLVIRLSHLGDIILTEPTIRSIRSAYPDAEIDFLTRETYREAVNLFDGLSSILTLQIPGRDESLRELSKSIKRKCREHYDLVIDLHNNLRTWWIRLWLNADGTRVYSKNWRARWNAVRKKLHKEKLHTVDLYLSALRGTGIPPADRNPHLGVPHTQSEQLATSHGLKRGEYCIFAVGASHPTKHYPIPQWVELAEAVITDLGTTVVVSEQERHGYLNLFDELEESGNLRIITDLKLPQLAMLVSSARFTVSNDSGIMHLSAALGVPTVGLFGPTHPSLGFAPLGERSRAVTTNESCSPCSRHGASPCYRDDRYCFTKMNAGMIMNQVREVIGDA